jgi:hypothetical protein
MVKSYKTLATLIRGRLARDLSEQFEFFHEKGVVLETTDEDLHHLKTETDGHISEFYDICSNGIIYRDTELVCYKGPRVPKLTLEQAKTVDSIFWNKKTVFAERVQGKRVYMYWDPKAEDWEFANDDKAVSRAYGRIVKNAVYNPYNIEYFFTYVFVVSEKDDKHENGIYLEKMIDNKKGTEVDWQTVWNYAMRMKVKPVQYYLFEGFEKLEPEDFPVYVLDMNKNRILLTGM